MTVNPAVKVGIIVFIALLLFGVAAVFLTGYRGKSYPIIVVFDDIMGLTEGSSVTMAGVRIGRVDDIKLNDKQQAVVTLKIGQEYRIPENSVFVLRVGLLVGEKSIDIIPNRASNMYLRRNTRVVGQVSPRIEDILPDARRLVANLTEVSATLRDTLTGVDFKGKIDRSLANLESATANLDLAMAGIRDLVSAQSDEVSGIVNNVLFASKSLRDLTSQLDRIAQEGRFGESIGATLASAQRAAASLERTTASLEQLVTAPDFQADIRETVSEARQAVTEARNTIAKVNRALEGPKIRVGMPTRETSLESLYIPDNGRFRTSVVATLARSTESFLKVGVYDIGGTNKLILQPGQLLDSQTSVRYGIYASKLGVGLDHLFSKRFYSVANMYDPVDPRLDILTGYKLGSNLDVLLGVDKVFDDNQLTLGVRLSR